jgi:hypothetical protein
MPRCLLDYMKREMSRIERSRGLYGTYAGEIGCLFQDENLMSHASQRDGASETGSATTNDNKMDLEGCLFCGFMGTRLGTREISTRGVKNGDRYMYGVGDRTVVHNKRGRSGRDKGGKGKGTGERLNR